MQELVFPYDLLYWIPITTLYNSIALLLLSALTVFNGYPIALQSCEIG